MEPHVDIILPFMIFEGSCIRHDTVWVPQQRLIDIFYVDERRPPSFRCHHHVETSFLPYDRASMIILVLCRSTGAQ